MLFLRKVISSAECEVAIDYYVPFTINLENEKSYASKTCWRTVISVNKAHLVNGALENIDIVENGTPVFLLDGNIKNGLCDQVMDFCVYLNQESIMVNLSEESHPHKYIELERVRFGFDKDNKLISVIIKDLSCDEYSELKDGLKL